MPANEIELEVLSYRNEDEALAYLMKREKEQGIGPHHSIYWRRRAALRYCCGWIGRDVLTRQIVGLATLPVYEEYPDDVEAGIARFDPADFEELPAHVGFHCLIQPAIMFNAALLAALIAPPQQLVTHCPISWAARDALLGLKPIGQPEGQATLRYWPSSIAKAAAELKKHVGLANTTTTGKNGSLSVAVRHAGWLFGWDQRGMIARIAAGDLSAVGHDPMPLIRKRSSEGPCSA